MTRTLRALQISFDPTCFARGASHWWLRLRTSGQAVGVCVLADTRASLLPLNLTMTRTLCALQISFDPTCFARGSSHWWLLLRTSGQAVGVCVQADIRSSLLPLNFAMTRTLCALQTSFERTCFARRSSHRWFCVWASHGCLLFALGIGAPPKAFP